MKSKKRIILIIVLILSVLYVARIFVINKNAVCAETLEYKKGEIVDFGNDYIDSIDDSKPGYAVQVLGYRIVDTKTFYEEFNLSNGEDVDTSYIPYYCLVKVKFYNKDSTLGENGGISLYQMALVGDDYLSQISENVFCTMYPDMPGMNFSLQKGTSMEFELPYPLDVVTGKDKDDLNKKSPYIEISEFPNRKLIKIK